MATPVPSAVRGAYVESGGPGVLRLPTNHTESLRVRPSFWRQSLKSQGLDRELFLLLHLLVAARVCHSSCLQCDSTSILFATLSGDSLYVCPLPPPHTYLFLHEHTGEPFEPPSQGVRHSHTSRNLVTKDKCDPEWLGWLLHVEAG